MVNVPSLNGITLPVVTVTEYEEAATAIRRGKFSPEQLVELAIYLKRIRDKVSVLDNIQAAVKEKIEAYYDKLAPDAREGIRTEAGMTTYAAPKETVSIRDRDETMESLTTEQIRASYKPDVVALKIILKPDAFERLVKRSTAKKGIISIRDSKGAFEEIEWAEF